MERFGFPENWILRYNLKNLPLPIHACVQESARVCARPPECARVYGINTG